MLGQICKITMKSTTKSTTRGATPNKPDPRLLREDHILCLIMDAGLAIQAAVKRQLARRRARRALADLDEHQLRDIGVSRAEALHEGRCERSGCDMSRHAHA